MARILIVGGGCPGRELARRMIGQGHAVRITTRAESGRSAIEAAGAECWVGTPDRLLTLRGALDGVTIACWLLAHAQGGREEVSALHSSRLEFFLSQAIDTTVRGLIYDASSGSLPDAVLAEGARIFTALTELNAIPALVLGGLGRDQGREGAAPGDPEHGSDWIARAEGAVRSLLGS